ncbi:hypothetical protein [Cellulomonas triticagri]|nr:hypothetical protein [Cellulomonas triticagri]
MARDDHDARSTAPAQPWLRHGTRALAEIGFWVPWGAGLLIGACAAAGMLAPALANCDQPIDPWVWVVAGLGFADVAVMLGMLAGFGLLVLQEKVERRYRRTRVWKAARGLPPEVLRAHVAGELAEGRRGADMWAPQVPGFGQRAGAVAAAVVATPVQVAAVTLAVGVFGWVWAPVAFLALPTAMALVWAVDVAWTAAGDWWHRRRARLARARSVAAVADLLRDETVAGSPGDLLGDQPGAPAGDVAGAHCLGCSTRDAAGRSTYIHPPLS